LNFKTLEKRVWPGILLKMYFKTHYVDLPPVTEIKEDGGFETINSTPHNYYLVDNYQKRQDLIKQLLQLKELCFDTETTTLDVIQAQIVGMSFSWKKSEAYYVPLPSDQTEAQQIADEFRIVFEKRG